jgi:hypothetical protein
LDVHALGWRSNTDATAGFGNAVSDLIHAKIQAAGSEGIEPAKLFVGVQFLGVASAKTNLKSLPEQESAGVDTLFGMRALSEILSSDTPSVQVLGYDRARLVAQPFVGEWQIACHTLPKGEQQAATNSVVFPRQWFGIHGEKLPDVWRRCVRTVFGTIMQKPGITEVSGLTSAMYPVAGLLTVIGCLAERPPALASIDFRPA